MNTSPVAEAGAASTTPDVIAYVQALEARIEALEDALRQFCGNVRNALPPKPKQREQMNRPAVNRQSARYSGPPKTAR